MNPLLWGMQKRSKNISTIYEFEGTEIFQIHGWGRREYVWQYICIMNNDSLLGLKGKGCLKTFHKFIRFGRLGLPSSWCLFFSSWNVRDVWYIIAIQYAQRQSSPLLVAVDGNAFTNRAALDLQPHHDISNYQKQNLGNKKVTSSM